MTIMEERLGWLDSLRLEAGGHEGAEDGFCVMEAAAYIAGEPWSDHPKCASPVITSFLMRLNDRWNDTDRQLLKPYVTKVVGTRTTDEDERTRRLMVRQWVVHTYAPLVFRRLGHEDFAARMDALPTVDSAFVWQQCRAEIRAVRDEARERRREVSAAADAAAAAVADADAVADAAADAVAYYADADAVAVAVAVADADADADADAVADAVEAAVAYAAADADAQTVKAAYKAAAKHTGYWDQYNAAADILKPYYDEVYTNLAEDVRGQVFDLLDRLCEVGRA